MHAPLHGSQDSSAQRLNSAAHWYFQGPVLSGAIDYSPPWFPMDAEANRGLEEAYLRRGGGEVNGGFYQVAGVSYHANFTLMTQARDMRLVLLKTLLLFRNVLHTHQEVQDGTVGIDLSRRLMTRVLE